jgi:hypothetical protein
MYLTDELPPRREDPGEQVDVLALFDVVVREARDRAVATVAILASLFAAETKQSHGALELEDLLLEHGAAFLLRYKEFLLRIKEIFRKICSLIKANLLINYYNFNRIQAYIISINFKFSCFKVRPALCPLFRTNEPPRRERKPAECEFEVKEGALQFPAQGLQGVPAAH